MPVIMTTKRILNTFLLLNIGCFSAFAQVGTQCKVKSTGVPGICKFADDCPIVDEQSQNGITPTLCGFYQLNTPIVCCENEPFLKPNEPNTLLNRPSSPDAVVYLENGNEKPPATQSRSKSAEKCAEYSKSLTDTVQAIPLVTNTQAISVNVEKCNYNGVALIVGGKPASAGEFPFMAAIGFFVDDKVDWRCGGTLISEEYVLTAAHCTLARDSQRPEIIRLGEVDFNSDDDGSQYVDFNVRNIIVHPDYNYPVKYNDIALLQMSSKTAFNEFIRPACLYTKHTVDHRQAVATGWGKTDYAAADTSSKLMKVALNLYTNSQCARSYPVDNKKLPKGVLSSMLCAGDLSGGRDTCQGDSGGPLLVTKKGNQCKFYVIGVTSFGKSCAQANTPAIYTRVSDFVPWIEQNIW